ncbi:hypothetical protein jhhlp_005873 [Lomentospora prolificans]|uniref:Replication factor A protein 3 n=1 Tax=Lomentospora prolificans TaxID=41688 RepID=A0A2N3N4B3_9PEZI|nr:hypothetical protein jhhlp_005873 [Lomentospora prolificans]
MSERTSTPRITAEHLSAYRGRNVIIVGKVLQLRGDSALLDSHGNVTLTLNRDTHLVNGNAAQIIGKVNPDLSVKVLTSKDLGNNLGNSNFPGRVSLQFISLTGPADFGLYQSVVDATQNLKPIFQYE